MTYRDDLEAAHARIAALEAELERRDSPAPPEPAGPLPVRLDPVSLAAAPLLYEHNRLASPPDGGHPSGVRCPQCASVEEDVELRVGLVNAEYSNEYVAVACPRCLFSGYRRVTAAEAAAYTASISGELEDDPQLIDWGLTR